MKKIFIVIVFALSTLSKDIKAQAGVPDTLAYLQTIVANKAFYIGKPFSILLSDLQIQIKHFSIGRNIIHDTSKETFTSFAFYFPQSINDHYLSYPRLRITWQSFLNANQSDILWINNNGGGWSSNVAGYYSNSIIADIKIRE